MAKINITINGTNANRASLEQFAKNINKYFPNMTAKVNKGK